MSGRNRLNFSAKGLCKNTRFDSGLVSVIFTETVSKGTNEVLWVRLLSQFFGGLQLICTYDSDQTHHKSYE